MEIKIQLKDSSYDIYTGRNILKNLSKFFDFENKKVLIVTDSNIPEEYIEQIKNQITITSIIVLNPGESSKSFDSYIKIMDELLNYNFSRKDIIISLGGGVISDLVGFVSSSYKRGIKYINIPTSTLAMIDSSIGGKTSINYKEIKNVIGSFYQPSFVLIDFDLLNTLSQRNFNNGLVEALKMGYIYDSSILELFNGDINSNLEKIINKSILGKKYFVEQDEKEEGIRKILNYGHTFGHGFESLAHFSNKLYHGEAVALGMLMVNEEKDELEKYLKLLNISYDFDIEEEKLKEIILQDKKIDGDYIDLIMVDKISEGYIKKTSLNELDNILKGGISYVRHFRK